jgi:hypothetical protein
MANVTWTTPAELLGIINERDLYSKQLEANSADSASLTYSKIAGTLPPGIQLTSTGLLQGVPFEVATRSGYTFVIRASDGTNVADRTFSLQVVGADIPVFTTASGQLDLSDSTRVGNQWVLDGSYIEYQMSATDTDTATGQTLVYDIIDGALPSGVTMSTSGLISGAIRLADNEKYGPIGGFDNPPPGDGVPYDPTTYSVSKSMNYEFTVRVSDGTSYASQVNSIFVYTADFWKVDNNTINVSSTQFNGFPLVMSLSSNRRPVFKTQRNLGTYRHDNQCVIRIDVEDFDPLQADLSYSISSGTLPSGLNIDADSGEIYGLLPVQSAVVSEYTFTVRASRSPLSGVTVYGEKEFVITVIGDIDVGIAFTTPTNVGTIIAGLPSLLNVQAVAEQPNRVLTYSLSSGSLPSGLSLTAQGNIIGKFDIGDFTVLDSHTIKFDSDTTTFDRQYSFGVTVSDQYQTSASTKDFTIKLSFPYSKVYGNLYVRGLLDNRINNSDINVFNQMSKDPNINNSDNIFRLDDPLFGLRKNVEMLLVAGLESKTLSTLQLAMELNHEPKNLYFGDIKTAVAKENNSVKYEVVYIEIADDLINNSGKSVSSSVTLRSDIAKPMIGPRADLDIFRTDRETYSVTTDGGLSFSISGSKIRYANELTADIGYFEKLYPNAIEHMRKNMKNLGEREYVHLPLWMRTTQDGSGVPLGYTRAVVLAYCNPGKSALVKKRLLDKNIDFKKIFFKTDRYVVDTSTVDTNAISPDGSTKNFELNEIVHEEEIKVRANSTVLRYGNQVTADDYVSLKYLSADTQLRSADFEPDFSLLHDGTNKKTTIKFINAPSANTKIRVERNGDKYLAFKRKIKE